MKIKIGDSFYRYIDMVGIFHYIVKGVRTYCNDEQYELECQTCKHGYKCLLLTAFDDKKRLQYVRLLNEDEENPQYYFHTNSGQFYKTKEEAMISKYEKLVTFYDEKITKAEINLKSFKDQKEKVVLDLNTWKDIFKKP